MVDIADLLRVSIGDSTKAVVRAQTLDWRFSLVVYNNKRFVWDDEGSLAEYFESESIESILAASVTGNLDQLLTGLIELLPGIDVKVEAGWTNPVEKFGAHYIESVDLFVGRVFSEKWHIFARDLIKGTPVLMIGDMEGSIELAGFYVFGPGEIQITSPESDTVVRWYKTDDRVQLPAPTLFATSENGGEGNGREKVVAALNGLTRALIWYWIANAAKFDKSDISLYFTGSRVVEIRQLRPCCATSIIGDVRLADWTFATEDPARLEAVRKATSTVIDDNDTFADVAIAVLRNAESLYEISRRSVIAEALATRRTARQAAISASNDAVKSAREATSKASERFILQIAASLGIVIANAKDLINAGIALVVILIIGAATFVTWRVSRGMDLKAARDSLDNFVLDLDEYRDTLSRSDIEQLKKLRSIATATSHLRNAEKTATHLFFGVMTALFIAAVVVVAVMLTKSSSAPAPSPSVPSGSLTPSTRSEPTAPRSSVTTTTRAS